MAYEAPIASLTTLKTRLEISDTNDDGVLSEILLSVSGAIEAIAGRSLRRLHCLKERFVGGTELIQLSQYPIAEVHWIRTSDTSSFDDPDDYEELDRGDWQYHSLQLGARIGEGQFLRSTNGMFESATSARQSIEVCYTAGYKTPDEVADESSSITIDGTSNTSLIEAFTASRRYSSSTLDGLILRHFGSATQSVGVEFSSPVDWVNRLFVSFKLGSVFIPSWLIYQATLVLYFNRESGASATSVDGFIVNRDIKEYFRDASTMFGLLDDPDNQIASNISRSSTTFSASTSTIHSDAAFSCASNIEAINSGARNGVITFGFKADSETLGTALNANICGPAHGTAGQRPSLVLAHCPLFRDEWTMPNDLQSACLMQAAHDFATRKEPGHRQQTQRGVSISSGISYLKDPADLLPMVKAIAARYAPIC